MREQQKGRDVSKKSYSERIHELPCIVCWKRLGVLTYGVHAHHAGDASDRNDFALVPLCENHHTGGAGIHGLRRKPFFSLWKTSDLEMLAWTNEAKERF